MAAARPASSVSITVSTRRSARGGATPLRVPSCLAVIAVPSEATTRPTVARSAPARSRSIARGCSPYGSSVLLYTAVVGELRYFGLYSSSVAGCVVR
ncbi:MAG: hypothetical protein ACR2P2_15815 [Nakamurella sp.]